MQQAFDKVSGTSIEANDEMQLQKISLSIFTQEKEYVTQFQETENKLEDAVILHNQKLMGYGFSKEFKLDGDVSFV